MINFDLWRKQRLQEMTNIINDLADGYEKILKKNGFVRTSDEEIAWALQDRGYTIAPDQYVPSYYYIH
jgi:hypothetical protein